MSDETRKIQLWCLIVARKSLMGQPSVHWITTFEANQTDEQQLVQVTSMDEKPKTR